MPIRINLLSEAQAAEQLRRRDPVKFAIYGGVLVIAIMLAWWSYLEVKTITARGALSSLQQQIDSKTNAYQTALVNKGKIADANSKLEALNVLSAARFLQGNLLNALQQSTVDGVQLMRFREEQSVSRTEATKPTQGDNGRTTPGRPATATFKVTVTLDAKDSSATPGDKVDKFKSAIAEQSYFKSYLSKTNGVQLVSVSPSQIGPDGRPYILFSLQCNFPEVTR
ncbi:MAG TPA: hypothetical protein VFV23_01555 [Verrucomicrobiae bacterium]|nr:hypothetical protein [Verrucomicrobiae bacterium]